MKYLVMETHPAYAVLLDEEGRYLKAANLRYQVGDTVEDIVALRKTTEKTVRLGKPLAGLAAMAACLCLAFFGYYQPNFTAYGTLRIQINPDVKMTISRTERVLGLEGLNRDGMDLIEGYSYQGKRRDAAADELVARAIDMGYLSDEDTVSITVSSRDAAWRAKEEARVFQALEDRYGQQVVIRVGSEQAGSPPAEKPPQAVEVVIPVSPQTPPPAGTKLPDDGTDYVPGGVTGYRDTDYGPNADGITDYDDIDDDAGGITDYSSTGHSPYSGGADYGDRRGASDGGDDHREDDGDAADEPDEPDDDDDDDNDDNDDNDNDDNDDGD